MFRIGLVICTKARLVKPTVQLGQAIKCASIHTSSARNEAKIISGTKLAGDIHKEVKAEIDEWMKDGNRAPHLAAVLVGDDPASATYIKNKVKACSKVGISSETISKPSATSQEELLQIVDSLNTSDKVDGILVQLPLPEHIDERTACNAIAPEKDVDGFHITNIGRLCLDQQCLMPATPAGVWEMIKRSGVETFAKIALVCGRSKNVGMPAAMLLHTDHRHERPGGDATVIQTHRYTPREHLKILAQHADIIIAAAGVPGLITADMIKEGACVIDVGINRIKDEKTGKFKLVGDVDFDEVKKVAGHITPVPGGVGPMTVAMLCKNTIQAAKSLKQS
uniref:Bifunctional methylenetetrahydrofolate dehydrogenase/cyclohydrolase, mitochondrial-like n=1 Tax=Phallusia mammillata TaxID=59560 RepID=A0A6F9DKT2_9ASCI|nr:bifunctional methylenetetrahydrofolate dehydrogenase/cyclohydrolase, mitochondrial-like [Phallusia mammillata]